ncbi:uncharacterized protein LOC128866388 isoform X2 [Anastrepha ludens]|uniref:uncharacterized protein LOC128866388 isoform X2 n=1 Tax=Anastrepha ludens TaxID=28586 RepID=UPI0023B1416C|nr:uncharacterized protein LOC128866388 isoform X2 [Anastrepha ludens]
MDAEKLIEETAPMDYRLVCRTCLASDGEFYKLDSPILMDDDDNVEKPVSFMECLRYCTRLGDGDDSEKLQFPIYICTECSASLQVSYNFIRNALEAHEILRQKLSEYPNLKQKHQKTQRKNGIVEDGSGKGAEDGGDSDGTKMRFRCKICNEKVETKKTLKEHVKLHLDIISYCCQLCKFESKKRTLLIDHYKSAHNTQPTREQLKPKTKPNEQTIKEEQEQDFEDTIAQEMEKIHNSQANEEYLHSKQYEAQDQQQELDMQLFLTPASSNASAAAAYVEAAATATAEDVNADPASISNFPMQDEPRPNISTELQQYGADQFNIAANELSVGNEFIVMADGTVEEVMGNGVVIEYINAADDGVTLENGLVLDNIMQVENPTEVDDQTMNSMDIDDIIIEESMGNELSVPSMPPMSMGAETTVQTLQNIEDEMPPPSIITVANVLTSKRIKCKICTSNFHTQDQLKNHMLTHNEIPHFFCDQCTFYTFFKIDLTQHYKTKHKLQPTQKQLQPKNKVRPLDQPGDLKHIYACDLCLFETRIKSHLRRHYLSQHQEEATEVQLRPTIDESAVLPHTQNSPSDSPPMQRGKALRPDYPKGLNCKKCAKTFYWRDKLKDHYRQHNLDEGNGIDNSISEALIPTAVDNTAPGTSLLKHNTMQYHMPTHNENNANTLLNASIADSNYTTNGEPTVVDAHAIVDAAVAEAQAAAMQINMQMNAPAPDIIMDIPVAATNSTSTVTMDAAASASGGNSIQQQQPVSVMAGYACTQIPSDAVPQIVETDTTIDNSELDFVFNDALFEDFEEDENEDEENEEDDGTDFHDLLLTSDDDFDDILHDQQQQRDTSVAGAEASNVSNYQPYCVHCNKKFLSQYQFENHMFVHRGLAPYRCEMCTNLYNTKRALIRHYRAVHKKMPTRDMIQAKGDKVVVDHTPIEHLNLIEQKAVTLMCAKCPFESVELHVMQIHLNTTHGLVDENCIMQKLPFECPRCIRSYATRARLIRHLERSHSVATIIQQQRAANNAMRNQQQLQQQQQHQQYQPYIAIKDTITATTITTAASSAATPLAVIASTSTSTSCGHGIITDSYRFNNYNTNNDSNNNNNNSSSSSNNDDDDNNTDGVEGNSAGGGGGGGGGIEDNNNNDIHNSVNEVASIIEVSSLSKLIADMEHEEKSNSYDSITPTMGKPIIRQRITKPQHEQQPAIAAAATTSTTARRKSATSAVSNINTYDMYHQLNENNELFDEYACGMCSQSWRTAAELHAHECLRVGSDDSGSKSGAWVDTSAAVAVTSGASDVMGAERVGLITSERSLYLFKCDICHCNYKSSELLKHHMKRHTARIFRCSHCPKSYINRSELRSHQLSHTGEKPHKCDMCPKQFRYPHHLKRHADVVHLGKRARCPVESCGRVFTTQAQLKIHSWIHDGNEPYRCKYCRHSFKKRESLRKHTRRIHQCDLTEEEIAEIYRQSVGHTNPHDFTVSLSNGRMLRRSDIEQVAQRPHKHINDLAAESPAAAAAEVAAVSIVQTDMQISTELSPLLASNNHHNSMNIKLEMGVEDEDETAAGSVLHVSRNSASLSAHEETLHTYMLPGMEEHGQLHTF